MHEPPSLGRRAAAWLLYRRTHRMYSLSSRAGARKRVENPCPGVAIDVHQLIRFVASLKVQPGVNT